MKLVKKYQLDGSYKEAANLISEYKVRELKESVENGEILTLYRKFIRICEELSNGIALPNNSLSLVIFTEYLIKMGYFSYSENMKVFKTGVDKELVSKSGLSIVLGSGLCRHYASFTTDLFKRSDMFCENFPVFSADSPVKNHLNEETNHVANLIEYNGIYYVYDTFNHSFFDFKNPVELIEKTKLKDKIFLYYRPRTSFIFDKMDLEELERKLQDFKRSSESEKISLKELYEIEKETKESIAMHGKTIKEFAVDTREIKKDMHVLSKKMRSLKNY